MFENGLRAALYSPDFAREVRDADPFVGFRSAYQACPSSDPVDRALYVDVKTYLVDDIMTKVDKMSMAVSLESREPLLDHELLAFAASIPSTLKIRNGRGKYLLRRLLARRIPQSIAHRPKQGFAAPIGQWLRGPLVPMVQELLLDGRLKARGVFDDREVARIWREHRDGVHDHPHRLWTLVMLELWFRRFIDGVQRVQPIGACGCRFGTRLCRAVRTLLARAVAGRGRLADVCASGRAELSQRRGCGSSAAFADRPGGNGERRSYRGAVSVPGRRADGIRPA